MSDQPKWPKRGEMSEDGMYYADEDGKVVNAYGVWVEKNMYGKLVEGVIRSTFATAAPWTQPLWANAERPTYGCQSAGFTEPLATPGSTASM